MNSIPRRGLLGIALFCSGLTAASYAAEPYTLDGKDLAFSRQQIAAKDPLFVQAQAALLKKADLALNHPPAAISTTTTAFRLTGGRIPIPKMGFLISVKMGKPTLTPIATPPIRTGW